VIDEDCARSFGGANAPFSRAWACGILAGVVHRRVGAVGHLAAVAARKAWRRGAAGRRLASLGCLAGLFCSHVAMAQTGQTGQGSGLPLRLTIDAPAGCPDRATFLAQVKGYAARVREASPGELAPTIHVEMRPGDADFRGILTVRDVDGEEGRREVRDVDCASVAAALAFVAAWQGMGFDIVGTLPGAFLHPRAGYVDAFVMHRALGLSSPPPFTGEGDQP